MVTPVRAWAQRAEARDPFIERLIAGMTIEEKAGQLTIYSDPARTDGPPVNPTANAQSLDQLKADIAAGRLTGLFNGIGVAGGRELQRIALQQSRTKIPMIFAADTIHGMKTTFPVPLGGSVELRSRARAAHRAGGGGRGFGQGYPMGCSRRWSMLRATSAGGASSKDRARMSISACCSPPRG